MVHCNSVCFASRCGRGLSLGRGITRNNYVRGIRRRSTIDLGKISRMQVIVVCGSRSTCPRIEGRGCGIANRLESHCNVAKRVRGGISNIDCALGKGVANNVHVGIGAAITSSIERGSVSIGGRIDPGEHVDDLA